MLSKATSGSTIFLCAIVFVCLGAKAQAHKEAKPNLSGTWKLDASKGNFAKYSDLDPSSELILVISHTDPKISVTRKFTREGQERVQELTYYSNGRGETNPNVAGASAESHTGWNGNKLVLRYLIKPMSAENRTISLDVREEWKLSADGKMLTQTARISYLNSSGMDDARLSREGLPASVFSQVGPSEIKKVFNRIP